MSEDRGIAKDEIRSAHPAESRKRRTYEEI